VLELFPRSARLESGELLLGGLGASELAREHGTPVVVYCEETVRAQIRAYREAAPGAFVCYGTKAFPNVALLRVCASEGLGADVSTLGELKFALRAGMPGARLVVHGNNKSDEELRAAAEAGALVVLDSLEEIERGGEAGVSRTLVRVTPGIEAETHEAIRTAHHGSKFGLTPDDAVEAVRQLPSIEGLHVHIGSQLLDTAAAEATVDWMGTFAARARAEAGWTPATVDLGGGLGVPTHPDDRSVQVAEFVSTILERLRRAFLEEAVPQPDLILEPGRSLVGRAGLTLYTIGSVKQVGGGTTYAAVDGGMSDNPRPALYGARYTALIANRAEERPSGTYAIAGKHCESGDVLIDAVELPAPRRGDVLAVPATGGYTLGMSSNYNAIPRPAAILVSGGKARVIRRRETIDDLLAFESS
jgi:diaminopimelate decarboxylase